MGGEGTDTAERDRAGRVGVCVAAFLIGAAALGLGRATGSYQGGSSGLQMILRGGAGALVVASAASFVSWLIG